MRPARTPISRLAPWAGLALAAAAAASVPLAATTAGAQTRPCFRANDWLGASAGGPHDLYIRVNISDVWHLAMAQECPGARFPGPVSIGNVLSGPSNQICSVADLQITVKPRGSGVAAGCIVTSMQKLTPDEVKALPKKAIPD
jgi:hypothetical protein